MKSRRGQELPMRELYPAVGLARGLTKPGPMVSPEEMGKARPARNWPGVGALIRGVALGGRAPPQAGSEGVPRGEAPMAERFASRWPRGNPCEPEGPPKAGKPTRRTSIELQSLGMLEASPTPGKPAACGRNRDPDGWLWGVAQRAKERSNLGQGHRGAGRAA